MLQFYVLYGAVHTGVSFCTRTVDVHAALQSYETLLILQYYVLYEALESELEANRDHPVVAAIHFPDEFSRLHLVVEDLDYFYDKQWRHLLDGDDVMPCVATRRASMRWGVTIPSYSWHTRTRVTLVMLTAEMPCGVCYQESTPCPKEKASDFTVLNTLQV